MSEQSATRAEPMLRVDVRSEIDPLVHVAMCLANPDTTSLAALLSVVQPSVRAQLRHNAWSSFDWRIVREQQECFAQLLRDHGATVHFLPNLPGISSQHYTRDIGFCIDDTFFVSRMGTRYRQQEVRALAGLFPQLTSVVHVEHGRIEGGDVMLTRDIVLVGLSEATDLEGVAELRRLLAARGSTRTVVPVPFTHRGVIHLDTKFNLVGASVALFARRSFDAATERWLAQRFDLIEATDDEVRALGVNTFVIGGGWVVLEQRCERLAGELARRGLQPILVDYAEVTRWPGAFRCTTLPLQRMAPTAPGSSDGAKPS